MNRVLITGGATGLGRAIAQRFVDEGAAVAILDRNGEALRATVASLGSETVGFEADVSDTVAVERAVADVTEALGGLSVLVNNAGVEAVSPLLAMDEALLRDLLDVNVLGPWRCTRAAAPHLGASGAGAVVNLSSVAGTIGSPMLAGYSMTKAAVIRMTEALAIELRAAGVRVNAVCPGLIGPTRMVTALQEAFSALELPTERLLDKQGRMGETQEVADLVAFLASPAAEMVNGAHYMLDGGLTAGVL